MQPMEEHMNSFETLRSVAVAAGLLASAAIGTMSVAVPPARAADPPAALTSDEAKAALARMSKTLTENQFSFRSHTVRAYVGANGELLHVAHTIKAVVRRPDHLLVDASGDDGSTKMIYDGKTLVMYSVGQKQFAQVPVSGPIQQMLDVAESRMGADFPLADFLTDNPEKSVLAGITSGGQVGTATIDGVPCRHFFFIQSPDLELELWLEDNDRSLPRRVFITYRSLPGHPTFLAELSDWDFSVHPTDADFAFQPPAGVTQVELTAKSGAVPAPEK
jgi:hypothetical protein